MLKETFIVVRDLPRVRDIIAVLARHGMGNLVQRLGLAKGIEKAGDLLHIQVNHEIEAIDPQVRMRRVLEELGPTFIKLGQVLATRVDMFPPEWIAEFEKLQSDAPATPFVDLLHEVQVALGQDPHDVFDDLDAEPIGSASIAQVHRARLKTTGEEIVLKIRRPGIIPKIEADLRVLRHIAALAEFEFPEMRRYQPTKIVDEFAKSLRRELNFSSEARHLERFAQNFADSLEVEIPRVYREWTSERLIVLSYVGGVPGNDLPAVDAAGLDRRVLASRGADAVLKMVLIDGYFHADPHPGNVKYLPGNRLAFLDFGMIGRLPHPRRDQIVDLLAALSQRDEHGILNVLLEWTGDAVVDEEKMAADIADFIFNYENLPLKDIQFGTLLNDIVAISREHELILPADLTLLFKALISLEGLGRQLDPEFQMVPHLTPFVKQVIISRYHPANVLKRGRVGLMEALHVLSGVPKDIGRLVKQARRGNMRIDLDLKRLDHFGTQMARSANRLTMGIITGAMMIGSAIISTVNAGPTILGIPVLGFLGFLFSSLITIWLMFAIWVSGKQDER